MRDRNDEIAKRVLRGERPTDIAKEYGISPPRVRQIVAHTCRRQNLRWFKAMPTYNNDGNSAWGFDLKWIREHRRVFFDDV